MMWRLHWLIGIVTVRSQK